MAIVLQLDFNGADGSTVFVDSSASAHVITAGGDAELDIVEKILGTASLKLAGSGYATAPDSADWEVGTNDWEIRGFFRLAAVGVDQNIFMMRSPTNQLMRVMVTSADKLSFHVEVAGAAWGAGTDITGGTTLVTGIWYYFKLKKIGETVTLLLSVDRATFISQGTLAVGAGAGPTGTFLVALGTELSDVPAVAASNRFTGWIDQLIFNNGATSADVVPATPSNGFFNLL